MLIEALKPLRVKTPTGDIVMEPGIPLVFNDDQGQKLVQKAPGKVKALLQRGDVVYLDGEGPLTVLNVDIDKDQRTWVLVDDEAYQWRFVNYRFVNKVER